jgi:serine/threonine protein kinase
MSMSLIGKRLGNYDIQSKIGEGGMGMVYLGVHPQIGKKVAIKVLHEELCSKADVVARFFNEAKAVNDISHPNIVDIIDFGETTFDGAACKYIIMEFLEGESLAARMKREGVSIRETLHIIAQCASALAASHVKNVVHRDLKPENVYLCQRPGDRNYVKLLDFGIAKLLTDQGANGSNHTRTGMVIGTPTYMSPEQCDGKGLIDHRADIYALGIMMYELLTGKVPFPGEGFGEVLVAHLTREPEPPRALNPNVPPELEAIVLRCLKKRKEDRFQSMNDLLAAVADPTPHYQAWLGGQPAPVAAPGMMANPSMMMPSQMMASAIMPAMGGSAMMPASFMPMGSGSVPAVGISTPGWQPMQPLPSVPSGPVPATAGPPQRTPAGLQAPLQSRTPTGMVAPGNAAPMEPMPVAAQSGARPSTLQAAAGEASQRRRPRNVLLGFAGAMAFGVLSVVSAKLIVGKPTPVSAAQPAIERVRIVVKTTPASAEILPTGEGVEVKGWRPFSLAAKKDGPPITLRIKAEGYKEETRTVEPTSDQTLTVDLTKLVEEATPTPPPETASTPGKKKKGDKGEPKKTETKVADTEKPKDVKPAKGTEPAKDPKPGKAPDPIKDKEPKADKPKTDKPAGDTKPAGKPKKKKGDDLLPPVF